MLLYRYKVTKHIFCGHIFVYIWPNRQNTVWNIGKCNSVTFCKSFRMFSFLDTMLMWGIFTCIYLYQSRRLEREYLLHFTWLVPSSKNLNSQKGASINVTLLHLWFSSHNVAKPSWTVSNHPIMCNTKLKYL